MNWDQYYLRICEAVASNSKCMSRHIGAIIVKDKSIISTGYNGPSKGIPPCYDREISDPAFEDALHKRIEELNNNPSTIEAQKAADNIALCPRQRLGFKSGQGLEFCVATHAEVNAIVQAACHGISVKDTTIYMNCPQCCKNCLGVIINSGIIEIVVTGWEFYDKESAYIIKESGIKIRTYQLEHE